MFIQINFKSRLLWKAKKDDDDDDGDGHTSGGKS